MNNDQLTATLATQIFATKMQGKQTTWTTKASDMNIAYSIRTAKKIIERSKISKP
jgi:hypothetical protein